MALTNEQERALKLLREGLSTALVAERLKLPRPTVWRWQHELPEFASTVPAAGEQRRARLSFRDVVRIAAPLLLLLLAGLFFYYGY